MYLYSGVWPWGPGCPRSEAISKPLSLVDAIIAESSEGLVDIAFP